MRFWMRSLPGAGWWSQLLPLVTGRYTHWGGFRGRVMLPLQKNYFSWKGVGCPSGSSRTGLTMMVRKSYTRSQTPRAPPSTGTSQPVELPKEQAGPSHRLPCIFWCLPDDRMLIAALEKEPDLSGDDDSATLPPFARPGMQDSDLEMLAIFAWAAERVALEWKPPPCPELSRLDDWFLRVACAGCQGPTLLTFFPEVHDKLTGSWTAHFTARNHPSGLSSLTNLDVGAAWGIQRFCQWSGRLWCNCVQIPLPPGVEIHRSPPRPIGTRWPWPEVLILHLHLHLCI